MLMIHHDLSHVVDTNRQNFAPRTPLLVSRTRVDSLYKAVLPLS